MMESIKRLRVVFFALMIFGAFANFAQNEWGIGVIIICEALMALTFIVELIIKIVQRITKKENIFISYIQLTSIGLMLLTMLIPFFANFFSFNLSVSIIWIFVIAVIITILAVTYDSITIFLKKSTPRNIYENFFLFVFFLGMVGKNNSWPGSAPALILSCAMLLPYYLRVIIQFFRQNYFNGKLLVSVLSLGSIAGILLSISFLFKTMHWPFATVLFYISLSLTSVMIVGTIKWNYEFKGEKINIMKGIGMLNANLILIYFMAFTYCSYSFLTSQELAPKFYSQDYPEVVDKLKNSGLGGEKKAQEIRDVYNSFFFNAEKSGFLK